MTKSNKKQIGRQRKRQVQEKKTSRNLLCALNIFIFALRIRNSNNKKQKQTANGLLMNRKQTVMLTRQSQISSDCFRVGFFSGFVKSNKSCVIMTIAFHHSYVKAATIE